MLKLKTLEDLSAKEACEILFIINKLVFPIRMISLQELKVFDTLPENLRKIGLDAYEEYLLWLQSNFQNNNSIFSDQINSFDKNSLTLIKAEEKDSYIICWQHKTKFINGHGNLTHPLDAKTAQGWIDEWNKKYPEILHWMEPVEQLTQRLSPKHEFLQHFTEEQMAEYEKKQQIYTVCWRDKEGYILGHWNLAHPVDIRIAENAVARLNAASLGVTYSDERVSDLTRYLELDQIYRRFARTCLCSREEAAECLFDAKNAFPLFRDDRSLTLNEKLNKVFDIAVAIKPLPEIERTQFLGRVSKSINEEEIHSLLKELSI